MDGVFEGVAVAVQVGLGVLVADCATMMVGVGVAGGVGEASVLRTSSPGKHGQGKAPTRLKAGSAVYLLVEKCDCMPPGKQGNR